MVKQGFFGVPSMKNTGACYAQGFFMVPRVTINKRIQLQGINTHFYYSLERINFLLVNNNELESGFLRFSGDLLRVD